MPTIADIAALTRAEILGGPTSTDLAGVASLTEAGPGELSFLTADKRAAEFAATRAAAVIVSRSVKLPDPSPPDRRRHGASANGPKLNGSSLNGSSLNGSSLNGSSLNGSAGSNGSAAGRHAGPVRLIVDDAELALSLALPLFAPPVPHPPAGIDPMARVDPTAAVDPSASVGPFVVVGASAVIGKNVRLHAGSFVGEGASVGDDGVLFPNAVVRERCTLGRRVVLHAGATIGSDGFGYRWDGAKHCKVPQVGTVTIGDDVEIGSCSCVDRAKFGATVIGAGTKIDNLVQVGHNVRTGPHCIIVGQAAIAGSVRLGAGVIIGGQTAIQPHAVLGNGARVAACAAVVNDVEPGQTVSGVPALPHRQSLREQATFRRLPELMVQVRKLQEEVDRLKAGWGNGVNAEPRP